MHRYAERVYGAGPRLSPNSSADTLDLALIFDNEFPRILSESPSADTISTFTDSDEQDIPPCPPRPKMVPPLLALRSYTLSDNSPLPVDKGSPVIVSIPTPSRLSRSLWEPVFIKRWIKTHLDLGIEPCDEVPWAGPKPTKPQVWRPAGSLYHPSDFKKALQSAKTMDPPLPPLTFGAYTKVLNRERQIIGHACSPDLVVRSGATDASVEQVQRSSFESSVTARLAPGMEDIMAELEDLDTFFRDGLVDPQNSTSIELPEKENEQPSELSTNEPCRHSFPMGSHPGDATLPLAARRGKNDLPPLRLQSIHRAADLYPSIPTAFLGSPTACSPQFHLANTKEDIALSLDQMVANLRSKCYHSAKSPTNGSELSVESPVSTISFAVPSDQAEEENDMDEWAFAATLLDEFGSQPSEIMKHLSVDHDDIPETTCTDPRVFAAKSNPNNRLSVIPGPAQKYSGDSEQTSISPPKTPQTPVPNIPLPVTPASTPGSSSSSPKNVRGILKNNKSVRFASLPTKSDNETTAPNLPAPEEIQPDSPSQPIAPRPASQLERPLRTRTIYRGSRIVSDGVHRTLPTSSVLSMNSEMPLPERPQSAHHSRPLSVPPPPPQTHEPLPQPPDLHADVSVIRTNTVRHSVAVGRKLTPLSLSRLPKFSDANKEKTSYTAGSKSKNSNMTRWTMNEVALKRTNAEPSRPQGVSKSRMPVPLRNILTKFK